MLKIEEMYKKMNEGKDIDIKQLKKYINSYENVVLWGAGNLGKAIGEKLTELDINITCYWDIRAKDIKLVNDITVIEPFSGGFNKNRTIIICTIANGAVGINWYQEQLNENGFEHFLLGMNLYAGLVCPFKKGDKLNPKICSSNSMCSLTNCKKYVNLIERNNKNYTDDIIFQTLTFIISRKCTLQCVNCGQRLNSYPPEKTINYPLKSIKKEIDIMLDNVVDVIGMISLIGGEPFLHPNMVEIVEHFLTKKNFGVINITTNGICKITGETLQRINDDRVKIHFSDYTNFLDNNKKELFKKNVQIVKESGISYSEGIPIWSLPAPIENYGYSLEQITEMKNKCESTRICSSVVDGKYVPCSIAEVADGLELSDIEVDYVDILKEENIRERFKSFLNKPYYNVCRYCSQDSSIQVPAGEQPK